MKAVTIAQLDIKDHVRWAQDQQEYDVTFIQESHLVAPHPEILGTSAIYTSKFEELFELQRKNVHWAFFAQPANFHLFSKRFFSFRLFPSIYWNDFEEEEEEEEEKRDSSSQQDLVQQIINTKSTSLPQSVFEKDKTSILNLLETIKGIEKMLRHVNAHKLRYQKG